MFGKITYWNQPRGYGFITVRTPQSPNKGTSAEQFFFHHSNFKSERGEIPQLGAFVTFALADAIAQGKKVQAVGVRFATAEDIRRDKIATGAAALANGVSQ